MCRKARTSPPSSSVTRWQRSHGLSKSNLDCSELGSDFHASIRINRKPYSNHILVKNEVPGIASPLRQLSASCSDFGRGSPERFHSSEMRSRFLSMPKDRSETNNRSNQMASDAN